MIIVNNLSNKYRVENQNNNHCDYTICRYAVLIIFLSNYYKLNNLITYLTISGNIKP